MASGARRPLCPGNAASAFRVEVTVVVAEAGATSAGSPTPQVRAGRHDRGPSVTTFDESVVESAALDYLREIGYATEVGPTIGPGGISPERATWDQVYLLDRLRSAARRINPHHTDLVDEAIKRLQRAESQSEIAENFRVHRLLIDGVPVEYRAARTGRFAPPTCA